jgi:hypothetical protein
MKANELRIGNYYYGDVLFPSEYNVITANDLVELDSDPLDDYYQPLPLTQEWLLRFGFQKDGVFDKFFTYLPIPDLCMDKLSFRVNEGFICYESIKYRTLLKHIQYVHQLQNLYFALTNEELTMK